MKKHEKSTSNQLDYEVEDLNGSSEQKEEDRSHLNKKDDESSPERRKPIRLSNVLKVITLPFRLAGRGIVTAAKATWDFVKKHKTALIIAGLAILAGLALAAVIIFAWPAAVGLVTAALASLPVVGTTVAAFFSGLGLVGAAAVIGAATTAALWVTAGVTYGVGRLIQGTFNMMAKGFEGFGKGIVNWWKGEKSLDQKLDDINEQVVGHRQALRLLSKEAQAIEAYAHHEVKLINQTLEVQEGEEIHHGTGLVVSSKEEKSTTSSNSNLFYSDKSKDKKGKGKGVGLKEVNDEEYEDGVDEEEDKDQKFQK